MKLARMPRRWRKQMERERREFEIASRAGTLVGMEMAIQSAIPRWLLRDFEVVGYPYRAHVCIGARLRLWTLVLLPVHWLLCAWMERRLTRAVLPALSAGVRPIVSVI